MHSFLGSHSSSQSSSSEFLNKKCNDEDFENEPIQSSSPPALVLDLGSSNQESISLSSNPDPKLQLQNSNPTPIVIKNMSLNEFLQNFDRRNSDSSLVVNKSTSTANRVSLLDEIKKITDYLFKIKSKPCKEIASTQQEDEPLLESPRQPGNIKEEVDETIIDKKCEQDKEQHKNIINSMHNKQSELDEDVDNNQLKKISKGPEDEAVNEKKIQMSSTEEETTTLFKKLTNVVEDKKDGTMHAPWSISTKRTKFRINQMSSRDVPIFKVSQQNFTKLQKQNAIVTSESLFQETIIKPQTSIDITEKSNNEFFGSDLMKKFQKETSKNFQHHMQFKKFEHVLNDQQQQKQSISFDFGGLNMDRSFEQRTINSITTFFQLHAKNGTTVQQIKKEIEAKNK
jgi:hypothetical protein